MNNRWIYLQQLDLVGETFFLLKYLFNQYNVEGEVVEVNNSCAKPNLRDAFYKLYNKARVILSRTWSCNCSHNGTWTNKW